MEPGKKIALFNADGSVKLQEAKPGRFLEIPSIDMYGMPDRERFEKVILACKIPAYMNINLKQRENVDWRDFAKLIGISEAGFFDIEMGDYS